MKEDATNEKKELKRRFLRLLFHTVLLAAALYAAFGVVFLLWRVQGQDMFPAVHDGDLLLASRRVKEWRRGDVVIYRAEGERRIGRIVAVGTDKVSVTEDGRLLVNGALQTEEIFYPTEMESEEPVSVPEGTVYILGDNRSACLDSRDFGPIPITEIEGKVTDLFRRREL